MPVEAYLHKSNPYAIKSTKENLTTPTPTGLSWYPTVVLNIDFKKALPEAGVEWLFVRAVTKQIRNGRMDIDVVILDEDGDIVALSQHVALAVDSSRNVAKRKNGSKI